MPEERLDDHLNNLDDLAGWAVAFDPDGDSHALGFDEWNALRLATGQPVGEFAEYLAEIAPRHSGAQKNL